MKEDILEQIVEGWFSKQKGTFTKCNIPFKPLKDHAEYNSKKDSVASDIDILAVHLSSQAENRISVATCKSWQNGFDIKLYFDSLTTSPNKKYNGREIWQSMRELVNLKWAEGFRKAIYEEAGSKDFTYYVIATKLRNKAIKNDFENCEQFLNTLSGNGECKAQIKILELSDIIDEVKNSIEGTSLETTEVGRMIQLFKVAKLI